jgi:hypothetical protein
MPREVQTFGENAFVLSLQTSYTAELVFNH